MNESGNIERDPAVPGKPPGIPANASDASGDTDDTLEAGDDDGAVTAESLYNSFANRVISSVSIESSSRLMGLWAVVMVSAFRIDILVIELG